MSKYSDNIKQFANEHGLDVVFGKNSISLEYKGNTVDYNPPTLYQTRSENWNPEYIPEFYDSRLNRIKPKRTSEGGFLIVYGDKEEVTKELSDWIDNLRKLNATLELRDGLGGRGHIKFMTIKLDKLAFFQDSKKTLEELHLELTILLEKFYYLSSINGKTDTGNSLHYIWGKVYQNIWDLDSVIHYMHGKINCQDDTENTKSEISIDKAQIAKMTKDDLLDFCKNSIKEIINIRKKIYPIYEVICGYDNQNNIKSEDYDYDIDVNLMRDSGLKFLSSLHDTIYAINSLISKLDDTKSKETQDDTK